MAKSNRNAPAAAQFRSVPDTVFQALEPTETRANRLHSLLIALSRASDTGHDIAENASDTLRFAIGGAADLCRTLCSDLDPAVLARRIEELEQQYAETAARAAGSGRPLSPRVKELPGLDHFSETSE